MLSKKYKELEGVSRALLFEAKEIKEVFELGKIDSLINNKELLTEKIRLAMENLKEIENALIKDGILSR